MSFPQPDPLTIPPELEAEMTPVVRAFVGTLLERIGKLEAKLGMNPRNSSLPPSSQHPHARPQPPKRKSNGHCKTPIHCRPRLEKRWQGRRRTTGDVEEAIVKP